LQTIADYVTAHRCEAQYERESAFRKGLHALVRFAQCKGVPFLLSVLESDLGEAIQQLAQLSGEALPIAEDARKVAAQIHGAHDIGQHAIMVGHSQGNLMIAQALELLPSTDHHPTNVGNACTAILTLASPARRALFHGIEPQYLRGLRVEGDILQLVSPSDFDVIHTPDGDSVAALPVSLKQLKERVEAHYVDKNYLLFPPSANRVSQELTILSDECSAGSFSMTPASLSIVVRDTMGLGVSLLSRTSKSLKGRTFGADGAVRVSGSDSTLTAVAITPAPVSVSVQLDNTSKVSAAISVKVDKRPMLTTIQWTEEALFWDQIYNSGAGYPPGEDPYPCGRVVQLTDPDRAFRAFCRFRYSVTASRADGGSFTSIYANPIDSHLGPPSHQGGGDTAQVRSVTQLVTFEAAAAADTRFEVSVSDAIGLIAVDTIGAAFAGRFGIATDVVAPGAATRAQVAKPMIPTSPVPKSNALPVPTPTGGVVIPPSHSRRERSQSQ
jgi:hypothetical protein